MFYASIGTFKEVRNNVTDHFQGSMPVANYAETPFTPCMFLASEEMLLEYRAC